MTEPAPAAGEPAPGASLWLIPALSLAAFMTVLSQSSLAPFLPLIADSLGVGVALLGQAPALTMLTAAGLGLVLGPVADQYGPRRVLLVGLGAIAVSALGSALAPSLPVLVAVMLVGALGRATVLPVALTIAGMRFSGPAQRRAVSWTSAGTSGAPILGVPLLTTVAALLDWRAAFVGMGLLALTIAALLAVALGGERGAAAPPRRAVRWGEIYRPVLRHGPTVGLLCSSLLGNASLFVMFTYLGAFYIQRHGFDIQQVGLAFLTGGLGLLVGNVLTGERLGHLPVRPTLVATRVASAVLMGAALALPLPAWLAIVLLVVNGLAIGATSVCTTLLLTTETPASRATALTLNGSAYSIGIALGSGVGGLLLTVGGFVLLGLGALALGLATAALAWWSRPPVATATPAPGHAPGDEADRPGTAT